MFKFSRTLKSLSIALVLGASLGVVGCGTAVGEPEEPAAAEQAVQEKAGAEKQGMKGPLGRFARVLSEMELRADQQKTVDALMADLEQKAEPIRKAKADGAKELAKQVRAGKVDRAALEAQRDAIAKAAEAMVPAIQDAANKLHATLDADQREALIEKVREHRGHHGGGKHHGPGEARGPGEHRVGPGGRMAQMKEMAERLGITEAQRDQIRDAMKASFEQHKGEKGDMHAKFEEGREKMKAFAEAFVSDSFNAKEFDFKGPLSGMMHHGGGRMLHFVETAMPILNAEQRVKLADEIEARAADWEG